MEGSEKQTQLRQNDFLHSKHRIQPGFNNKKMKFNPLNKAPPTGFKCALHMWIKSGTLEGNTTEAILLDSHYKFKKIDNTAGLLDVINRE